MQHSNSPGPHPSAVSVIETIYLDQCADTGSAGVRFLGLRWCKSQDWARAFFLLLSYKHLTRHSRRLRFLECKVTQSHDHEFILYHKSFPSNTATVKSLWWDNALHMILEFTQNLSFMRIYTEYHFTSIHFAHMLSLLWNIFPPSKKQNTTGCKYFKIPFMHTALTAHCSPLGHFHGTEVSWACVHLKAHSLLWLSWAWWLVDVESANPGRPPCPRFSTAQTPANSLSAFFKWRVINKLKNMGHKCAIQWMLRKETRPCLAQWLPSEVNARVNYILLWYLVMEM